jgi:hypothetical protein
MPSINDILRDNFKEYEKNHKVSEHQRNIVRQIIQCRSEDMGYRILLCKDCRYEEITYCSCRNRHCPLCLTFTKEKWINKRKEDMINTQYFHIVFTIPEEIKMLVKANEADLYDIMFKSVSKTILELAKDPKHLGALTGAMLVLHTWTQQLTYHPHVHCLIPGGGLDNNGKWKSCKRDFFIHVKILGQVFRGKFLESLEELHRKKVLIYPQKFKHLGNYSNFYDFKTEMSNKSWYVYSKETFTGPEAVISYLGRYTHKIGLTNNRIINVSDGKVTFYYIDNKDNGRRKTISLEIDEFIRRFLLHILPSGYVKIRYIGILSNRSKKTKLKTCQKQTNVRQINKVTDKELLNMITKGRIFICPRCKGNRFALVGIEKSKRYNKLE